MHITQKYILEVFRKRSPRRYMELKPREVESNTFMHHLNSLIKAGLIEKTSGEYSLTKAGSRFIMGLTPSGIRKKIQPIILVEVACQNKKGEWLLTKCAVEPFLGLIGFPAGGIELGETVADAAKRVLREKTGYEAIVQHIGNMYQQTYKDQELICHLLTHIFIGEIIGEQRGQSPAFWVLDMDLDNNNKVYFPGLKPVITNIQNRPLGGQFFEECIFEMNSSSYLTNGLGKVDS